MKKKTVPYLRVFAMCDIYRIPLNKNMFLPLLSTGRIDYQGRLWMCSIFYFDW